MTPESIKAAIAAARKFTAAAEEALKDTSSFVYNGKTITRPNHGRKSGAARRASMDLTRALADMRRPG